MLAINQHRTTITGSSWSALRWLAETVALYLRLQLISCRSHGLSCVCFFVSDKSPIPPC